MVTVARRIVPALLLVMAFSTGDRQAPALAHTMTGFTSGQRATIEWAVALFDEAGLALPGIDFVHHETTAPCRGRPGWFTPDHDRGVIDICIHEGGSLGDLLVLHEVAHAWDSHNLSSERRTVFLEWRGLTQWWGQDRDHWAEYGAEQAAEVLVWALIDRPTGASLTPPPYNACANLRAGYILLTGRQPLHGYTDRCGPSA